MSFWSAQDHASEPHDNRRSYAHQTHAHGHGPYSAPALKAPKARAITRLRYSPPFALRHRTQDNGPETETKKELPAESHAEARWPDLGRLLARGARLTRPSRTPGKVPVVDLLALLDEPTQVTARDVMDRFGVEGPPPCPGGGTAGMGREEGFGGPAHFRTVQLTFRGALSIHRSPPLGGTVGLNGQPRRASFHGVRATTTLISRTQPTF